MDDGERTSEPVSRRRRRRRPTGKPAASQPAPPAQSARDLAGTGHSQLDPARAARARDVNRPSAEDLATAQNEVRIVRRNWTP